MDILSSIESHLRAQGLSASSFGRQICNDPRLVFDLRNGRRIGDRLEARIKNHIGYGTKRDHYTVHAEQGKV